MACSFCKRPGKHHACLSDKARMERIDADIAARTYAPNKHPMHWERLREARTRVADQLNQALKSAKGMARLHIKNALDHLKECR